MLNIKIIVGSTRTGRFSEKLLPWLESELKNRDLINYEILDLKNFDLPLFDSAISPAYVQDRNYGNEKVNNWSSKINEADGFIIISPEYNHGYSAVLKNAIDVVYKEWNNKAVSFISYGSVGGGRMVEQLRQVAIELQMASTRNAVHIQSPWNLLKENNELKEGVLNDYNDSLKNTVDQLIWWTNALKIARESQN